MSRYDYPDPGLDSSYCDGLTAEEESLNYYGEPNRCFWCDRLLTGTDTDYCSALCANYALIDSEDR